ncbi:diguanylate cyclase (GGDEF)-like protein [Azospirillum fermentarium]|uniref:diguanylate cyclase n=1 Tax=Azospirillum fermentarium TaxID=1233114 RepID=UPI0022270B06|nr:diguanylate cyclase [Azospirillum fermentarium]MCW2249357.1 diguanylate cyclase (GGDEF)-like protein [Azospirillum fermentarium]
MALFSRENRYGLFAFLALLAVASPAHAVRLTPEEQAYLRDNPVIHYCADPDWEPYEVITDQGWHRGIAADLLRLAASRVGMMLTVVPTRTWEESIATSQAGTCKFLSFLNRTPKRDAWLIFTAPLFVDPNVIVTREEHPLIDDLGGLTGETMVLPSGTAMEERLTTDFPNLTLTTVTAEADAFAMVSDKRASMTMRSMIVAVHAIKKGGWFSLKVAGTVPGYENRLRIGVIKSEPLLRSILDKGIATITADEREQIANRHVAITVQQNIDFEVLWRILAACGLVLATSLFWIVKLRQMNEKLRRQSRTDSLTGIGNRSYLNERLPQEIDRARRYGRPFAVVLLDIDHFKAINDLYGHLTGDAVLRHFTTVIRATVRTTDMPGRWGGEEFLVLCPETTAEQALALAQRLCTAVRAHDFPTGRTHTVSAGVAALIPDDTVDGLLHRADAGLYRAKAEGRDRAMALTPGPAETPDTLPASGAPAPAPPEATRGTPESSAA